MSVTCSQCGAECSDTAKFCNGCGSKIELTCSGCNAPISINDKFCGNCGAALNGSKDSDDDEDVYDGPWRLTETLRTWMESVEWEDETNYYRKVGASSTGYSHNICGIPHTGFLDIREADELFKSYLYIADLDIE